MAATCSESGLKAMSNAMQLQDKSTIHTVDGHWLMQVYPVEVTHARQRSLTLLEHYDSQGFQHYSRMYCKGYHQSIWFGSALGRFHLEDTQTLQYD